MEESIQRSAGQRYIDETILVILGGWEGSSRWDTVKSINGEVDQGRI